MNNLINKETFKKNKAYRDLVIFISAMSIKWGREIPTLIDLFNKCESVLSERTRISVELITRDELKLYKKAFNDNLNEYLKARKELII